MKIETLTLANDLKQQLKYWKKVLNFLEDKGFESQRFQLFKKIRRKRFLVLRVDMFKYESCDFSLVDEERLLIKNRVLGRIDGLEKKLEEL